MVWMSAQLVMAGIRQPVMHDSIHDLESLIYVLIIVCALLDKPYKPKCEEDLTQCFDKYFNTFEPSVLKTITIQSDLTWQPFILWHISKYFEPIVPLLKHLRDGIISPLYTDDHGNFCCRTTFTHNMFITAIINTLPELEDDTWIPYNPECDKCVEDKNDDGSNTMLGRVKVEGDTSMADEANPNILPSDSTDKPTNQCTFTEMPTVPPPMLPWPSSYQSSGGPGFSRSLDSALAIHCRREEVSDPLEQSLSKHHCSLSSCGTPSTRSATASSTRRTLGSNSTRRRGCQSTSAMQGRSAQVTKHN